MPRTYNISGYTGLCELVRSEQATDEDTGETLTFHHVRPLGDPRDHEAITDGAVDLSPDGTICLCEHELDPSVNPPHSGSDCEE